VVGGGSAPSGTTSPGRGPYLDHHQDRHRLLAGHRGFARREGRAPGRIWVTAAGPDGTLLRCPRFLRQARREIAALSRERERHKKFSPEWKRAQMAMAKAYRKAHHRCENWARHCAIAIVAALRDLRQGGRGRTRGREGGPEELVAPRCRLRAYRGGQPPPQSLLLSEVRSRRTRRRERRSGAHGPRSGGRGTLEGGGSPLLTRPVPRSSRQTPAASVPDQVEAGASSSGPSRLLTR
jgi:hypothetical protein